MVGRRVREARKNTNPRLTQSDLTARLGVLGLELDRSAISKIESGRRPVYDFEITILAKALNVSCEWLLDQKE